MKTLDKPCEDKDLALKELNEIVLAERGHIVLTELIDEGGDGDYKVTLFMEDDELKGSFVRTTDRGTSEERVREPSSPAHVRTYISTFLNDIYTIVKQGKYI